MRHLYLAAGLAALLSSSVLAGPPQAAQAPATNPLLAPWTGPYGGVPPWDKVKPELFPAAFEAALAERKQDYDRIANNPAKPTFANTFVPMQNAGQTLNRVMTLFGVMTGNMNTPAYQALDREWSPKLSKASDEITFNPKLFARIEAIYKARDTSGLDAQQKRLVTRTYDSFVRQGAKLTPAQKEELSAFNQNLAINFSGFSQRLLADEGTAIIVTDEARLAGLPDSVKAVAKAAAAERGQQGWAIVNTRSAVDPVLTFATDRALREQVWRAFTKRGDNGDVNDTKATIARIVRLRANRAHLLGFKTHADWRMQDTMAKTPAAAMDLMMRVWPAAKARVAEEVRDMQAIADKEGAKITIEPWDYRFYQEKVRKSRYDLDQAELKPYFELNNIIQGSLYAANRLYGLEFKEITGTVPVFEPNMRVWHVTRNGKEVGLFYRDDFARTGKRSGAWANTYRGQRNLPPVQNVLSSNNNNFAKGAKGEPVLISLDDAETLFHEFGHAIHAMLQNVTYPGLAGTPRDFVEYPSQVNEHWLLTRDVLDKYARHYKTGQPMPQALLDKIKASETFNQGFATTEYLSSAIVDMKLHTIPDGIVDPAAFEATTLREIGMPKELVMRHRLPQFNHLFSSDSYSAGYYSYLWSETMDADTFAAFEEAGSPWDKATADRFARILLSTGNETDRAEAYRAFRGRDPDVNALLKQRGFPTK
ncbi:peptidase M3 family protein [Sphingomonas sp. S17]|uniref:M3 family metallopeptidase n=2 Tax=Sphingomonas paucimobilis TaxID=13689 RepID=A0A411LH20_SPHPI|nr:MULTISPECIES: M3 family metallopeptidase [Sphingomonas]EGI56211.1 peptidase M3 family protein [Sphingomonas sp. S17]MBQ1481498.1 M3 family metallopeptidase [Sphingomonas sp.]MCM3677729.1 M3 family metallopeptidase [Sphingomonas paucimobilis]MDG5972357.1 M3 family metallopeptidase [Sphingomonas paucimobilis]NNG57664.1 M3 family metallopeptidase [Sphingomonas paucimobilis]